MNIKESDFDPTTPEFKGQVAAYKRGLFDGAKAFNEKNVSDHFNKEIERKTGESTESYAARLKDTCIELMCSNRGYASCFEKINK